MLKVNQMVSFIGLLWVDLEMQKTEDDTCYLTCSHMFGEVIDINFYATHPYHVYHLFSLFSTIS